MEQRKELKDECKRLKDFSQRHNLLFFGVPEAKGEECTAIVYEIIRCHMGLPGAWRESRIDMEIFIARPVIN